MNNVLRIQNNNMSYWEVVFDSNEDMGPYAELSLHVCTEDGELQRDAAGWAGPDDAATIVRIIRADNPEHDELLLFSAISLAKEMQHRLNVIYRALGPAGTEEGKVYGG